MFSHRIWEVPIFNIPSVVQRNHIVQNILDGNNNALYN